MDALFRNRNGQSLVEYILLIAVLSVITFNLLNNRFFRDFLGEDSAIFARTREYIQYGYRHGRVAVKIDTSTYGGLHETYSSGEGDSHFFIPLDPYPEN